MESKTSYKNVFEQIATITKLYIDEENIWNSFFSTVKLSQLYPLVSSSKENDVRVWNSHKLKKVGEYYEYKIPRLADCHKNFKISLLPSDKQEDVTDIYLYMNKEKAVKLEKTDHNTFTLPDYIFSHPFIDLSLKFKIINDRMDGSITRFVSVEEVFLQNKKQKLLVDQVDKIVLPF